MDTSVLSVPLHVGFAMCEDTCSAGLAQPLDFLWLAVIPETRCEAVGGVGVDFECCGDR